MIFLRMNATAHHGKPPARARTPGASGQTMIFMIMALVIITFVVLWNIDLHKILHLKSRTQNAGDASALAAARWQGITLNLIGDLNIMQALALSAGDTNASEQISGIQARLCYAGPVLGLIAAQQAAKYNGIFINYAFTERLTSNANAVIEAYIEVFDEPFANCWTEYGELLLAVAVEGVAAGPDNAQFYTDYSGGHTLLTMSFYDAVAAPDWCWFRWNAYTLLETYVNYESWSELPPMIQQTDPSNSEIFGLGLAPLSAVLPGGTSAVALLNDLAVERGLSLETISDSAAEISCVWRVYDPGRWGAWSAFSIEGEEPFPAAGTVRPQYDYAGADAATRIEAVTERITPGASGTRITWTAAAKPFGFLLADETEISPNTYSLVLPAFREVRLIPVDTSSAPEGGSYNLEWRDHIEFHLPIYMLSGPAGLDADCWYCRQLMTWDDVEGTGFRQDGLDWLAATDEEGELLHPCESEGGPGSSPGGGRRRAH